MRKLNTMGLVFFALFSIDSVGYSACEGDLNCDGFVDGADLALFAENYGSIGCSNWLGKIEGRVQCESGGPVVGVTVYIPGDSFVSFTDDNGLYLLRAVPDGIYTVIVRAQGREIERFEEVEVVADTTTLIDVTTDICGQEVCDGIDNDWDGVIDEDLLPEPCELQTGVCAGSQKICGGLAGWLPCIVAVYPHLPDYEEPEMTCDGEDNNCDGNTDENLARECGNSSVGQCELGTQACVDGQWGVCLGEIGPSEEVCDDIDNDCDGVTDNNASCDDGVACTTDFCDSGQCTFTFDNAACDDGLSCTTDSCDSGGCTNAIIADTCAINGICYSEGELKQGDDCWLCDSGSDQYSWTMKPNGSTCSGGVCLDGVCQ